MHDKIYKPDYEKVCVNGHKMTADNTRISFGNSGKPIYDCRTCVNSAYNEKYKTDEVFREHKKAYQRNYRLSKKNEIKTTHD